VRALDPDRLARRVGARIAELRRAAGLTQQALADRMGVSLRRVQRLEGDALDLRLSTLAQLAQHLGAPVEELLRPPEETRPRRPGRPRARGVLDEPR
jgi:transcriptional regulator with XRE-family HTH domain